MIDYSQAKIDNIIVHKIGNRTLAEPIHFSRSELNLNDDETVESILTGYFLKPFSKDEYYKFSHPEELSQNVVYAHCNKIFTQNSEFNQSSIELAEWLYHNSNHAKIKSGEFYLVKFSNVILDGEVQECIGIFKSENKETFLKVYTQNENIELGTQEGINIKKLDKGCLVFNLEDESGYKVCSIDNINKGNEAKFWVEDFLGLEPIEDSFYFTKNYMDLCKDFVSEVYNKEHEVKRADQIDMLNKSMEYFDKKENFVEENFEYEVMQDPDVIDAFRDFKQQKFEKEEALPLREEFDISKSAVKGQKSTFKSILKLDKNFHIYIHGRRDYIVGGYDTQRGLNYYTLYYEIEN